MMSTLTLMFLSFYFTNIITLAQPPDFIDRLCNKDLNYTTNSSFQTNLDRALMNLPDTNSGNGFFSTSSGQYPDTVNAIALCRADTDNTTCRSCLTDSISKLREICPNKKDASGYYDYCLLYYSNDIILGKNNVNNFIDEYKATNVTDDGGIFEDVLNLLNNLTSQAAPGGELKYASGRMTRSNGTAIYGLVQCTPDLSNQQCSDCLKDAVGQLAGCCYNKMGVRILSPKCNIRYDDSLFYDDVAISPPPQSPVGVPARKHTNLTRTITTIVMTTAAVVIIAVAICIFAMLKKKKLLEESIETKALNLLEERIETTEKSILEFSEYDFGMLKEATMDFSEDNKIGHGGFGFVYKGGLQDGRVIAVKRLSRDFGQGEPQFKNEVTLVARLHHRNLVRLLGFCLEGNERLLIYEYMSNSSLDTFLFDPDKRSLLDWNTRYNIIEGVARGLLYLHEDSLIKIIHRDLKASNILLDGEMNAKISDFGMARLFSEDETQGNTRRVVGTYGYMAPEYVIHGQFSVKLDVFSFGVLVLEIVTGKQNQSFQNEESVYFLNYVWRNWRDGTISNIIDPVLLKGSSSLNDIVRSIHIALLCVQNNVVDRPTMYAVVLMLNRFSLTLQVPLEPAFLVQSNLNHIGASKESSKGSGSPTVSLNTASISEMNPR